MQDIQHSENETNDLLKFDKRILFITLKRKIIYVFIIAFITTLLAGLIAKFSIDDVWKSQTVLIRHKKNLSVKSDVPYLYQEMDYDTILQTIKMRNNLQKVIDSLKLDTTPERFYGAIDVSRGNRSNLINIRTINQNRKTAVQITNLLAEVFIESYVEILNSSSQKVYDYYLQQRGIYESRLQAIEDSLQNFREKHKILSLEQETQNKYDNLKELELELMNAQMQLSTLKTRIKDIDARITKLPEKVELTSTVSATQERRLKELNSELEILRKRYTDKNPKIIKIQEEIEALKKSLNSRSDEDLVPDRTTYGKNSLRESLILEKNQYENELKATFKRISEYENKIAIVKSELKSLSPIEREYYDIQNSKETTQEHLKKIKDRLVETKIAMDSNLSDFEILERAVPPKYPEASGTKMIAIVAGFLAFIITLIFFLGKEFFDFSVKSEFDFKEIFNIKFLGEIPDKDNVPPPIFYSQIQILYGQLISLLPKKKTTLLAVGKDKSETGATFIIQELVELLLSQNKKVLWIESLKETNDEIIDFTINKLLYQSQKNVKSYELTDYLHKAYFICDDHTFKKILTEENITQLQEVFSDFDLIFWELFDVNYNLQLFSTITSASDLLMFITRFRHSNRLQLSNSIKFLNENTKTQIAGVLNDSRKPYFSVHY